MGSYPSGCFCYFVYNTHEKGNKSCIRGLNNKKPGHSSFFSQWRSLTPIGQNRHPSIPVSVAFTLFIYISVIIHMYFSDKNAINPYCVCEIWSQQWAYLERCFTCGYLVASVTLEHFHQAISAMKINNFHERFHKKQWKNNLHINARSLS